MNNRIVGFVGATTGFISMANPGEIISLVATCICACQIVIVWVVKIARALRKLKHGDITEDEALKEIQKASEEARGKQK